MRDHADVASIPGGDWDALGGAHVVVLAGAPAGAAEAIAARAPAAVVVVTGGPAEPEAVLAATLFPRARVIGSGGSEPVELVDAIVLDRGSVCDCLVQAEAGGAFAPARARLGARGVEEVL